MISEIVAAQGIQLVGPVPPDVQSYQSYTAAIPVHAKEAVMAKGFIGFVTSPDAISILKSKGLERPSGQPARLSPYAGQDVRAEGPVWAHLGRPGMSPRCPLSRATGTRYAQFELLVLLTPNRHCGMEVN